ncbi:hypothetical protein FVE85_5826 [Porphyridium purpureum]|uniref:Thioredoxin domain-containing protein n=1 Tax=Porphyridium purpureum TaxID=35688 RepID=A0A5J4Z2Z4_PORPP|nr:hypothetical protein FVE85_5826 [Porphyridium purpureum]|eukprot:POR7123..scf295_1
MFVGVGGGVEGHGGVRVARGSARCMVGVVSGSGVQVQRFRVRSPAASSEAALPSSQSSWLVCADAGDAQLGCALVTGGSGTDMGGVDAEYVRKFGLGAHNDAAKRLGAERLALLVYLAVDIFGRLAATVDELLAWRGRRVVVIGGANSPGACFAVHALSRLGARVVCVTTATRIGFDGSALLKLGADAVIDPRKVSWSDELKGSSYDAVLDALADEEENARIINALPRGARYLSIMPYALKGSTEDGLLGSKARSSSEARTGKVNTEQQWSDVVAAVLERVDLDALSRIPTKLSSMGAVLEAATWPRDTDSGERYGFPAPSVWGDTSDSEGDDAPGVVRSAVFYEPEEGEEDEEQEFSESIVSRVTDMTGLSTLLEDNEFADNDESLLLFVSATSCKRCKIIKPQFEIIARELSEAHPNAKFGLLEIGRDKEPAKFLNVRDVPQFLLYRRGARFDLQVSTQTFDSFQEGLEKALA